jgi:hypothetical protein
MKKKLKLTTTAVLVVLLASIIFFQSGCKKTKVKDPVIISVKSTLPSTKTGINLNSGEKINITTNGSWCWGAGTIECCDANGTVGRPVEEERPVTLESEFFGVLIGRIIGTSSNSDYFRIGTSTELSAPMSGELELLMNDRIGFYGDNRNSITVTISFN